MKSMNVLLLVVLYPVEGKLVVRVEEMSAITVVDSSGTLLHFTTFEGLEKSEFQ